MRKELEAIRFGPALKRRADLNERASAEDAAQDLAVKRPERPTAVRRQVKIC